MPPYFASEKIDQIQEANSHIDALRAHRNAREVHRELRQTPQRAWDQAQTEGRSVLRPVPRCPWWDYVWSVRIALKVGPDGRVPIGTQRLRIERPPATKIVLCLHPTGHHSVLAAPARHQRKTSPPVHQPPKLKLCPVLITTRHRALFALASGYFNRIIGVINRMTIQTWGIRNPFGRLLPCCGGLRLCGIVQATNVRGDKWRCEWILIS